jgi:hypothetical protein
MAGYAEGITYEGFNNSNGNPTNTGSATNAEVVVVYAPVTDGRHLITWIQWSYSAAPTAPPIGRIRVQYGVNTVFDVNVIAGGPGFLPLFLRAPVNTRVRVRLASGGVGITGKLNVGYRLEK